MINAFQGAYAPAQPSTRLFGDAHKGAATLGRAAHLSQSGLECRLSVHQGDRTTKYAWAALRHPALLSIPWRRAVGRIPRRESRAP